MDSDSENENVRLDKYLFETKYREEVTIEEKLHLLCELCSLVCNHHKRFGGHGNLHLSWFLIDKDKNYSLIPKNEVVDRNDVKVKWIAPERLLLTNVLPSEHTDIFSFAFILLAVWKDKNVWASKRQNQVNNRICQGCRPEIPESLIPTDSSMRIHTPPRLTELIEQCWKQKAAERPTAREVLQVLRQISRQTILNQKEDNVIQV